MSIRGEIKYGEGKKEEFAEGCWGFLLDRFYNGENISLSFNVNNGRTLFPAFLEVFNMWGSFKKLEVEYNKSKGSICMKINSKTNLYDAYNALRLLKVFHEETNYEVFQETTINTIYPNKFSIWVLDLYRFSGVSGGYSVSSSDSVVYPLAALHPQGLRHLDKEQFFNSANLTSTTLKDFYTGDFRNQLRYSILPKLPDDMGDKREVETEYYIDSAGVRRCFSAFCASEIPAPSLDMFDTLSALPKAFMFPSQVLYKISGVI